jgi:hypothetical protein
MMDLSRPARTAALAFALAIAAAAHAQSSCSSDGQRSPAALLERFVSADCEACWTDAKAPRARPGDAVVDWVVPGARGDDAPLSGVASRDALARLAQLHRAVPAGLDAATHPAVGGRRLRVAHGLPFNGYIGASIDLRPGAGGPWQAWLLLVESIPAGTEGSPFERQLVRNALQPPWDLARAPTAAERRRLFESRPISVPEGANPKHLRVVGWVEDARGRIRAIAQSRCAPGGPQG